MSGRRIVAAATCSVAASVAFVSVAPAALAVSAHPKAGTYSQAHGNYHEIDFTLDAGKVTGLKRYDECVTVPLNELPAINVSKGRFSWDGKRKDVLGRKFRIHVDGKFVTRHKAKGTWTVKQLTKGSCKSSFDWVAVRSGPVPS
jgi:opacity protein-like surface antigen